MAESNRKRLMEALQDSPVIAAVKTEDGLERALESECSTVFLLSSTILDVAEQVERIKKSGKLVLVHADLVAGLGNRDEIAVDFLARNTNLDGIISTRPMVIRRTRELGLAAVQRFFVMDSIALENVIRQSSQADVVDILPGAMPSVIRRLTERMSQPLVASGLLRDKQEVMAALSAGAMAISTTAEDLWFI